MFKFLKKRQDDNVGPKHWSYDIYPDFKLINNGDSIQYINIDGSRTIYLSVLIVSGKSLLPSNMFKDEPDIINDTNGWQLKGKKQLPNEVIVCVVNFVNTSDVEWAKAFFNSIRPKA